MKRWPLFLLAVWPVAAAAQSFPLGIYDVADGAQLRQAREAGFSWVRCAGGIAVPEAFLADAQALGMGVIAPATPAFQAAARRAGQFPVWYVYDEPDVHKVAPQELERRDAALRADFPGARTTFSLGSGAAVAKYRSVGDFLLVDWYPVPHLALDSVADQLDAAKRAAGVKPVYMILQAFDWRKDRQPNPGRPPVGRFPTFGEIRFMTYLALVHGADGLFYYTFGGDSPQPLPARAGEWQAVRRVAKEISRLDIFLAKGEPAPAPAVAAPLEARAWQREGQTLVVFVNRSDRPVSLPPAFLEARWRPLFEARRLVAENVAPGGQLGPWGALVLMRDDAPWRRWGDWKAAKEALRAHF